MVDVGRGLEVWRFVVVGVLRGGHVQDAVEGFCFGCLCGRCGGNSGGFGVYGAGFGGRGWGAGGRGFGGFVFVGLVVRLLGQRIVIWFGLRFLRY